MLSLWGICSVERLGRGKGLKRIDATPQLAIVHAIDNHQHQRGPQAANERIAALLLWVKFGSCQENMHRYAAASVYRGGEVKQFSSLNCRSPSAALVGCGYANNRIDQSRKNGDRCDLTLAHTALQVRLQSHPLREVHNSGIYPKLTLRKQADCIALQVQSGPDTTDQRTDNNCSECQELHIKGVFMHSRMSTVCGLLLMLAASAHAQISGGGILPFEPLPPGFKPLSPNASFQIPPPNGPGLPLAPKSAWIENDRAQFTKLLHGANVELFIAPVQVRDFGLDRSSRSLMTGELTAAFAASDTQQPLNSYLVQRALGDGLRKIDVAELIALANQTGARKRLIVSAGHDQKSNLLVTLKWAERTLPHGFWSIDKVRHFTFALGPTETAAEVFRTKAIPEIATETGLKVIVSPERRETPRFAKFPDDLTSAIASAAQHPLNESMVYQVLGTLAPARPERARERLFEQSLIAIQRLSSADPAARLLRARATFYLHSRPAALAILGRPTNGAERALHAFFNGNLPEMEKAVASVDNEVLRIMLEMELQDLRRIYRLPIKDVVPAYVVTALQKRPEWQTLVKRRLGELDPWSVQSNIDLKLLLDQTMPIIGIDLEGMVRGRRALNKEVDEVELGMSALEHIWRLRQSQADVQSCAPGRSSCAKSAFLDLMEAAVISNAVKEVEKAGLLQGAYESAERLGKSYGKFLDGNAEFALALSRTIFESAQRAAPEQRSRLMQEQREHAILAAFWEQGQSTTAHTALIQLGVPSPNSDPYLAEYGRDLPVREYWFADFARRPVEILEGTWSRLRYSASDIEPAMAIASYPALSETERAALKSELEGRFVGHPRRGALFPAVAVQANNPDSQLAAFEAAQRARPDDWANYLQHGKHLIETKGAYKEGAAVFLKFPGFNDRRGYNAVSLSSYAFDAGSILFWRGAIAEARPLFKISADLKTGSAASMASEIRLNLLDRKFVEAAAGSLERGSRYDDPYAYRDYLTWLFVFGKNQEAWAAFDQLQSNQDNPQVWLAAHVGHRIEHRSWEESKAWLLTDSIRNTVIAGAKPALAEAILLNTVDRKPEGDLVNVMKLIEGVPLARYEPRELQIPHPLGEGWAIVDRSKLNPNRDPETKSGKLSSHLVMFADAYSSLRKKDFEGASPKFYKMASFYPIDGVSFDPNYSYALVYFAWASAQSGDKFKLEEFLEKRQAQYFERFDHHLAKAVFLGLHGDETAAISNLTLSFNYRPHTERRPIFTEYQWAETCEWLFEATGNTKYRDLALAWAKVHQKIQPMYAWAYAMEAKLTTSEPERLRALGMTLYLDPLSERAATFPDDVKKRASKQFEASNPFKKGNDRTRPNVKVTFRGSGLSVE